MFVFFFQACFLFSLFRCLHRYSIGKCIPCTFSSPPTRVPYLVYATNVFCAVLRAERGRWVVRGEGETGHGADKGVGAGGSGVQS